MLKINPFDASMLKINPKSCFFVQILIKFFHSKIFQKFVLGLGGVSLESSLQGNALLGVEQKLMKILSF